MNRITKPIITVLLAAAILLSLSGFGWKVKNILAVQLTLKW